MKILCDYWSIVKDHFYGFYILIIAIEDWNLDRQIQKNKLHFYVVKQTFFCYTKIMPQKAEKRILYTFLENWLKFNAVLCKPAKKFNTSFV
jgi:hypothetical protein